MDEAITRLKLAADVGADVCFIEGVRTKELLERTVKALEPKPVCPSTFGQLSQPLKCSLTPGSCQRHLWWFDTFH